MEIKKAGELGLCFGVKRAIELLKQAVAKYGQIETLGPVAHNQKLVQGLAELGIKPVGELGQVEGKILGITAHGVSPVVLSEIKARRISVIDTTCPIVRRAQNIARELTEAGLGVIIFGETGHSEVRGLLGWAKDRSVAALDAKQIAMASSLLDTKRNSLPRLGIISQTTQSYSAFSEFISQFVAVSHFKIGELRIVNTLCWVPQKRQDAAVRLAETSQLMIVVGGHDSANTRHLVEASSHVIETHLVEKASEVNNSWIVGKRHIGITAGTSTPDELIDEVVTKLKSLG
ncbi:MAG: 4-hydroxy-3-methylbut-2-enyl diphosphate reductase [Dehalococcoidia bacterium]|nr:4-hydroxy-3-methylbut-2-enyl diphosphate reductase [Dehalococcoidia bacterium]